MTNENNPQILNFLRKNALRHGRLYHDTLLNDAGVRLEKLYTRTEVFSISGFRGFSGTVRELKEAVRNGKFDKSVLLEVADANDDAHVQI